MASEFIVRANAGPVADAVLRRVVRAVAAQAELPIDRIQDAALIIDVLLDEIAVERVSAIFRHTVDGVEIAIGPLGPDEGDRILADARVPDAGPILHRLGDRVWIDGERPSEYVCVAVGRSAGG